MTEATIRAQVELQYALDRMSTPLHASRLSDATAAEDARCMAIIRAEIDRLRAAIDMQPAPPTREDIEWAGKVFLAEAEEKIDRLTRERDALKLLVESTCYALYRAGVTSDNAPDDPGEAIDIIVAERDMLRSPDRARLVADNALFIDRLDKQAVMIEKMRAERDATAKQGETFRRLVDACKLLSSEAEEYEFDDGMGRGAMLDYWYEFDRKLDAALAQIEQEKANGSR